MDTNECVHYNVKCAFDERYMESSYYALVAAKTAIAEPRARIMKTGKIRRHRFHHFDSVRLILLMISTSPIQDGGNTVTNVRNYVDVN